MLTVHFDSRVGKFHVSGDPRANKAFQLKYPNNDIVNNWRDKNIEVSFADPLSEEIYYGELNRSNLLNPVGLLKPLFDYQARSVAIATKRSGFAIWDQPGLGKTAQAIGWAYELIVNLKSADRAIIVTPGSIKTQFKREIKNFTGHEDVLVIDGDKNNRERLYSKAKEFRWIILNYDLLHLDYKNILPIVNGQLLIADEAHRIKNRSSKRGMAMRALSQKAQRRLALSGTPIENNPAEWYTIMNGFVVPGIFGSPIEFLNRYSYPGRFGGFEGARNLDELRARSQMHYIRNLKKDVATQLPILQVNNQILDPDEKYANALKLAHRDAKNEIEEKAFERSFASEFLNTDNHESGAAMTATSMLRFMCSSPKLLHLSDSISAKVLCEAGLIPDIDGPKLDYFRTLAKEYQENNERILLFTSFRKMAKLIAERLDEDSIPYVLYTGESSTKEREKAILAFTTVDNDAKNNPVVFIATDAAAEGLNLGKECSTIVNFDLSFKPSVMIQRANRIHRIDSDPNRRYRVINLTLAKTLEEGILQAIGNKADLSDAILGEAGTRQSTTGRNPKKILQDVLGSYDFS
jgi:SNF2 family DNA or RNA helicase